MVALPRDRFNAALRKRLQQFFLEQFHGVTVDYHLSLGETESARIFFTVHVERRDADPRGARTRSSRPRSNGSRARWDDDLRDALIARVGHRAGHGAGRASTRPGSPAYYKASDEWGLIVDDVLALEALEPTPRRLPRRHRERERGRAPHAREALQDRRQGRSLGVHARSSKRWACGRSRRSRPRSWARARSTSTTSGCWTAAARCSTWAPRPTRRGHRSPRSGAGEMRVRLAEPAGHAHRARLAPGADPARAPQVPHARVLAATPRSIATTPWPRTARSPPSWSQLFEARVRSRARWRPRRRSTRSVSRSTRTCGR